MNTSLRKQSAETIARWVFIALLAIAAIVFGAFYLIGFDRPYADDPNFNAPLLTDVVLAFVILLVLVAVAATVWAAVGAWRHRDSVKTDNGIPAKRIAWGVATGTGLLMVVTFLLGSTEPILVNGASYDDAFWLRTANMFVWSSLILIFVAAIAALFYTLKIRKTK